MASKERKAADQSASDRTGQLPRSDGEWNPNDAISQKLKALYAHTEQEAIPDRFLDLLEQLDEAERAAQHGNEG